MLSAKVAPRVRLSFHGSMSLVSACDNASAINGHDYRVSSDVRPFQTLSGPRFLFNQKSTGGANANMSSLRGNIEQAEFHDKLFADGSAQTLHVVTWHNPQDVEIWSVGILAQAWPHGRILQGSPSQVELWPHSEFTCPEDAKKAANTLALNHTYSSLKARTGGYTALKPLATHLDELPFILPGRGAVAALPQPRPVNA